MDSNALEYTYYDNRHCQLPGCSKPIPDQANKNRIYCPKRVLPDGSIENHKDDFNSMLRQQPKMIVKGFIILSDDDDKNELEINKVTVRKKGNKFFITVETPFPLERHAFLLIWQ